MRRRGRETFSQSVFALMVSQVVVKILGLFYRLYLTNRDGYGDEGNAIANGGFQVFALMLSVLAIGIPTAISKIVAETSARGNKRGAYKVFKVALVIFATIGMIGSIALYLFSNFLAKNYLHIPETRISIIALCPSVFLVSVISVFKGYFTGRESIKMTGRALAFDQLVKTISTVVMIELSIIITKKTNTEVLAGISNLATTMGNIAELVYLYYSYKKMFPEIESEINNSKKNETISVLIIVKRILLIAIPLSLTAIITTISKNIDSRTIINDLKDLIGYEEAKKQYGILSGKVDALINFPLSFNMAIVTALLPSIASTNGELKSKEERINQSFLIGMMIALPVTLIFFCFSDEILQFLFPNANSGGNILKISCLSIIFITIEQITNIILNGVGKNMVPIKAIALGVVIKAILNRVLVHRIELPIGGTIGASIATLVCHIVASSFSFGVLIKHTKIKISALRFMKLLGACLIMLCVSKLFYEGLKNTLDPRLNLLIALGIASLVFVLLSSRVVKIEVFRIRKKKT